MMQHYFIIKISSTDQIVHLYVRCEVNDATAFHNKNIINNYQVVHSYVRCEVNDATPVHNKISSTDEVDLKI